MFMLPSKATNSARPRDVAPAAKSTSTPTALDALRARVDALSKRSADLDAASTDYTFDYDGIAEDWSAEQIEVELNAARHILSEMIEVSPQVQALAAEAQAAYEAASDVSSAADSIDDLSFEIERLTEAVNQLAAELAKARTAPPDAD